MGLPRRAHLPDHQRLAAGAGGAGAAVLRAGTLPFWRQWRASPLTWLVTITALLLYHLLLFTSFRHAPVLEANLINYLWPLCIILFTPLLLPGHP